MAFTSNNPALIACAQQGIEAQGMDRTMVCKPIPNSFFFGVGGFLNLVGVPTVGLIAAPNHLMDWAPDGHLAKLDPDLMYRQLTGCAAILANLDATPAALLAFGGTQLLGSGQLLPKIKEFWYALPRETLAFIAALSAPGTGPNARP